MRRIKPGRRAVARALVLVPWALPIARAAGAAAKPKYHFKIGDVRVESGGDPDVAALARELLEKELSSRPEFTSDPGAGGKLDAYRVSLTVARLSKDWKPPKPGGRLKQLAVDVKLSVFGNTLPGQKLAFSGDGEAMIEGEVVERRADEEAAGMIKDVVTQALKQAVDQAVAKLSLPKSAPMNESKRRRKKP